MKEQCIICGSFVEDVSGVCPVCGSVLGRSTQVNPADVTTGGTAESTTGTLTGNQPGGQTVYQNPNLNYGQGAYNYQNPNMYQNSNAYQSPNMNMQPSGKKKVVFSVISIVAAVLGILAVCKPMVSLILCLVAIVFGIIALVKKQVKVPAIMGIVFGGIMGIVSALFFACNLMIISVLGIGITEVFRQSFDVVEEGCTELSEVAFEIPTDSGYKTVCLYYDGTYTAGDDEYGYYNNCSYSDEATRSYMEYETLYAIMEGYEMKEVTCIELVPAYGYDEYYSFVVPEGFEPGETIYYIQVNGYSSDYDYTLVPIITMPLN